MISIGKVRLRGNKHSFHDINELSDESPVRCIDEIISGKMVEEINRIRKNRDTLGGIFEVRVKNLPIGLGSVSQWNDRLDTALSGMIMSIPSVKGVEIGTAFDNSKKSGSQVHDEIKFEKKKLNLPDKGFLPL